MTNEKLYEVLGDINEKYVSGYTKKQRSPSGLNGERLQLVWL